MAAKKPTRRRKPRPAGPPPDPMAAIWEAQCGRLQAQLQRAEQNIGDLIDLTGKHFAALSEARLHRDQAVAAKVDAESGLRAVQARMDQFEHRMATVGAEVRKLREVVDWLLPEHRDVLYTRMEQVENLASRFQPLALNDLLNRIDADRAEWAKVTARQNYLERLCGSVVRAIREHKIEVGDVVPDVPRQTEAGRYATRDGLDRMYVGDAEAAATPKQKDD